MPCSLATSSAGDEPQPAVPAACSASAADEAAAAAMASACGSRVEVESERTEYAELAVERGRAGGTRNAARGLSTRPRQRRYGPVVSRGIS
ncbi:MAG: hypothetical protein E6J90_23295 [Deltaproteobacteria bacterium]|nr:MAG: hypothetical protein E6J91_42270 [Deltaproteobacteria bacterium]TMQ16716.1 MAG: hypothetical protein E6J90_23295 [Deltaproteobacteria bacterium]